VSLGTQEKCGFKQVTTDTGLDILEAEYTEEQASKNDITSEKECISGSPSALALASPNLQAGVEEAVSPDIALRGIVRVCASKNPATSSKNTDRWKDVGSCDSNLRCWLDTESVKEDLRLLSAVSNATSIESLSQDLGKLEQARLTYEETESILSRVRQGIKGLQNPTSESVKGLIAQLDSILETKVGGSGTNTQKAEALALKATIYRALVIEGLKVQIPKPEPAARVDGEVGTATVIQPPTDTSAPQTAEKIYPISFDNKEIIFDWSDDYPTIWGEVKVGDILGDDWNFYLVKEIEGNLIEVILTLVDEEGVGYNMTFNLYDEISSDGYSYYGYVNIGQEVQAGESSKTSIKDLFNSSNEILSVNGRIIPLNKKLVILNKGDLLSFSPDTATKINSYCDSIKITLLKKTRFGAGHEAFDLKNNRLIMSNSSPQTQALLSIVELGQDTAYYIFKSECIKENKVLKAKNSEHFFVFQNLIPIFRDGIELNQSDNKITLFENRVSISVPVKKSSYKYSCTKVEFLLLEENGNIYQNFSDNPDKLENLLNSHPILSGNYFIQWDCYLGNGIQEKRNSILFEIIPITPPIVEGEESVVIPTVPPIDNQNEVVQTPFNFSEDALYPVIRVECEGGINDYFDFRWNDNLNKLQVKVWANGDSTSSTYWVDKTNADSDSELRKPGNEGDLYDYEKKMVKDFLAYPTENAFIGGLATLQRIPPQEKYESYCVIESFPIPNQNYFSTYRQGGGSRNYYFYDELSRKQSTSILRKMTFTQEELQEFMDKIKENSLKL
jgi:hypothetical protein